MKHVFKIISSMLFVYFIAIGSVEICAQSKKSMEYKQKTILKKADSAYQNLNYFTAANCYESYLKMEQVMDKAVLSKLADCYWHDGKKNEALRVYKLLFSSPSDIGAKQVQLRIAELYARFNDYKHATQWLLGVDGYKAKVDMYSSLSKLESMKKDSLRWSIALIDINTFQNKYSPCLVDSFLYFSAENNATEKELNEKENNGGYARLWKISLKDVNKNTENKYENKNNKASLVGGFDDIEYNTAPVSVDKNKHFYFSMNYRIADKSKLKRLCLMEAFYTDDRHFKASVIPFGDPEEFTVMHPAVNRDGTLIVASSDKPGGIGNYDLYYAQRKDSHHPWGELKPLDSNVNTKGDEVFPTITSDGYLYYSSDAQSGLGGLDIFKIPLKDAIAGTNSPEHLSYPINTSSDDFGWTQDTTNTKGYFSSDRLGNNDIFSFCYHANTKVDVTTNSTSVDDKIQNKAVELGMLSNNGQKPLEVSHVNNTDLANDNNAERIKKFADMCLFTVLFKNNKSNIDSSNYYLMTALVRIMEKYPCLKLQIKSYTDIVGGYMLNQKLSKDRALSVQNYLISKGVSASRMDTLCFGKTQQLNQNNDAIERAMNRRVSFNSDLTGCKLDVDSLLSSELANHTKIDTKKIFVKNVNGKFMVQVGAFKTQEKADALAEKMKFLFPDNIYSASDNNFHQVRVGYFDTQIEAERMSAIIDATGILH